MFPLVYGNKFHRGHTYDLPASILGTAEINGYELMTRMHSKSWQLAYCNRIDHVFHEQDSKQLHSPTKKKYYNINIL